MSFGLFVACLGFLFAPLYDHVQRNDAPWPYFLGLLLMFAGELMMIAGLALRIRMSRRKSMPIGLEARWILFPITMVGLYLLAEGMAGLWISAAGLQRPVREFRERQRFKSTPFKVSHPFLILTNNPNLEGINAFGFLDSERTMQKSEGVVRIACIGASTTEDGYPGRLEAALRSRLSPRRFEVVNFANAGWTSAQNIINFELNVRHFRPDFVIIHEGVNDIKARGYEGFRTDYSHAFQPLCPPPRRADAELVWCSNAYALGKFYLMSAQGANGGMDVYSAISRPNPDPVPITEWESDVMLGNIEELIALVRLHNATPILTTMPYSRTNAAWGTHYFDHMTQLNEGIRNIAVRSDVMFVDLDKELGIKESLFVDPVHLTDEGVALKANALATALVRTFDSERENH